MADRRAFLRGAAGIGAGAALFAVAGCKNLTSNQVQNDAALIDAGLSGIVADLQNVPGLNVPADVIAKINQELAIIGSNAAQIGSLVGDKAPQAISTAVGVIAAAVAPFFPAAPMVAIAVQAAVTLAAALLGSVSAAPGKMSVAQARAVLVAAATK